MRFASESRSANGIAAKGAVSKLGLLVRSSARELIHRAPSVSFVLRKGNMAFDPDFDRLTIVFENHLRASRSVAHRFAELDQYLVWCDPAVQHFGSGR